MKSRHYLILFIFLLLHSCLFAQATKDSIPNYRKLHYLSEEEMHLPINTNRDFVTTAPPTGDIRMVAEYEPMQAVLIRHPFGIPYSLIREMAKDIEVITLVQNKEDEENVKKLYKQNNVKLENCTFIIAKTESYWTRDYGPWFVFDGNNEAGIVDFPYNRPRPNDNKVASRVADHLGINLFGMEVVHCGGNMMADGFEFASSTDLVYTENQEYLGTNATNINKKMKDYLGITRYDVVDDPLGDYIKHVDCWGKYLAPDKIMIGQVAKSDPRYNDFEAVANFFATTNCAYGYPYKVYRVFTPGGNSVRTPYTNSLILNNKVFVALSGSEYDNQAIKAYQKAMPGYEVIGISDSELSYQDKWLNTDALHCRTHEIADIGMLYYQHTPLHGIVEMTDSLAINTNITAYSGKNLITDSILLHYSINNNAYQTKLLRNTHSNNYNAYIKGYKQNDTIRYYLSAVDESGRKLQHPYMGSTDPHLFVVGDTTSLTETMTITKEQNITIYPNPFNEQVKFNLQDVTTTNNARLEIFDCYGKSVHSVYIPSNATEYIWTPSATSLEQGLFFYKLTTSDRDFKGKLIFNRK